MVRWPQLQYQENFGDLPEQTRSPSIHTNGFTNPSTVDACYIVIPRLPERHLPRAAIMFAHSVKIPSKVTPTSKNRSNCLEDSVRLRCGSHCAIMDLRPSANQSRKTYSTPSDWAP